MEDLFEMPPALDTEKPKPTEVTVSHGPGSVFIDFDAPLKTILLNPKQARELAEVIRRNSHRADQAHLGSKHRKVA